MEKIMLSDQSYLLNFGSYTGTNRAILIVPNSAGYFAKSSNYGEAGPRINSFCKDLSVNYEIFYLVLPGQDPNLPGQYGYTSSIKGTIQAIEFIKERFYLIGVIGMCTGGAIAVESLKETALIHLHLVLYNTAMKVGWHNPKIQQVFSSKYGRDSFRGDNPIGPVMLDYEELTKNAPEKLGPIIKKHRGPILQFISGKSDYKPESQEALKEEVDISESIILPKMSDVPLAEEEEYSVLIKKIFYFF